MPQLPVISLRVRLLLLILLALLPTVALTIAMHLEHRQQATTDVQANALRLAHVAAGNQARLLEGARQLLIALAHLPAVRTADSAVCSSLFAQLLDQYPQYANLGVVRADGAVVCSALPLTQPTNLADRPYVQQALAQRTFAIGDYQTGRISGHATINFGYPVLDATGQPQAVVFAALRLSELNQVAAEAQLPAGAALTVIDRTGRILARLPAPDAWVGQALPEAPLVQTILSQREGVAELPGLDGVPRLYAFTPVGGPGGSGLFVTFGIDRQAALAGVDGRLARALLLLGLISAIVLTTAWVSSEHLILRRMRVLLQATRRLSAGDLAVRTRLPHAREEVGELAQAFDAMAAQLEARQAEAAQAEAALQRAAAELEVRVETRTAQLHLANAQLTRWNTELEARTRQITQLNELSELLQACRTVDEASVAIGQLLPALTPADGGALCLLEPSHTALEMVTTWGDHPTTAPRFTPDDCWALRRSQLHAVGDERAGVRCRHLVPGASGTLLCIPMMGHGEGLGVLHVHSDQPLTETGHQFLVTVAEHIALALANLRLRETLQQQSIRDPLTGLFNRRYLEATLERELERATRNGRPLGLILLDVDHFKRFNDTFGHAAGDAVLQELATLLRTSVRGSDVACRYGGEEFLLLLPDATLAVTEARAEHLRQASQHLHVHLDGRTLGPITLSLGVAAYPEHGSAADALIRAADAALYQAKAAGRDRVVVTPQDVLSPRTGYSQHP